MKKFLKFLIGIIASSILLLYIVTPFVKVGDTSYYLVGYLKYILENLSLTFKNVNFTQVDMLYNVIVWLLMIVIVLSPIGCLILIGIRAILSSLLTKKDLKLISVELISFLFSGFLILMSYYLLNKYTLPLEASQLQIAAVKIACSHVWEPILYISAFGSLLMSGLNIYANALKEKVNNVVNE